jgi:hypothetical protein
LMFPFLLYWTFVKHFCHFIKFLWNYWPSQNSIALLNLSRISEITYLMYWFT